MNLPPARINFYVQEYRDITWKLGKIKIYRQKIDLIKNNKQYITEILSKKWPKFGQKGPFFNFPKNYENAIFSDCKD